MQQKTHIEPMNAPQKIQREKMLQSVREKMRVKHLIRRWYFTVEDFDDLTEYLGPDGESIDDCEAKRNPFLGTLNEAAEEADRRANLWEEREDCCTSQVTYHSLGKVKNGEAPDSEYPDQVS